MINKGTDFQGYKKLQIIFKDINKHQIQLGSPDAFVNYNNAKKQLPPPITTQVKIMDFELKRILLNDP